GATLDASINNLSTCEYWDFNRTSGSASVSITLGWNASSCNKTTPFKMRIAKWNSSLWQNVGGINSTGTISTGSITTASPQTTFGHFTFANDVAGYISIASGDWGTPTNWSPNGIPSLGDNVTISTGTTIDISTDRYCNNLKVNGTINWTSNVYLNVYGNYNISAGGIESATNGYVLFRGSTNNTLTVNGVTSPTLPYYFYKDYTITAGSVIDKSNGLVQLQLSNLTLTNLGTLTTQQLIKNASATGVAFINGSNSNFVLTSGGATNFAIDASTTNNTVTANANYVPTTTTGFYNLIIGGTGTTSFATNTIVTNNLTINSGATFSANGYDLTLGGNWLNNGTFTPTTKTVTFNGTNQTITKPSVETFYNLVIAGTGTTTLANAISMAANLTINPSATLDVSASNYAVNVKGNFTNNGTFTPQVGTVTFNGTTAQTIGGTSSTTFNGLAISNNAGVSITSGTYRLDNVLTLSNGTLNTNANTFTMTSNATQTARIAPITGSGAILGNFTVERFISARSATWADFSSPVQSSTFLDWANELPFTKYSNIKEEAFAATFDEKTNVFVPVSSSAKTISPGEGFEIFLTVNNNPDPIGNLTLNTIGVPNQGTQNFSSRISHNSAGSNLVGNPFAANISWASVYAASGGASSNLYDLIDVYNQHIKDWQSYTSASNVELGSSQGFWVYTKATGPYTLTIPESAKTTTSKDSVQKMMAPSVFTLKIADENSPFEHTFKMMAIENGNNGLDDQDLPFRFSPNETTPALYSMVEGKKINTHVFNSLNDNHTISLKTRVGIASTYTITADGFDYMNEYTCITLEDKALQKMIDLRSERMYTFKMTPTENDDRFVIHFSKTSNCKSTTNNTELVSNFANDIDIINTNNGNTIHFNLSELTPTTVSFVNVLGQTITNPIVVSAYKQSIDITLPSGYTGFYLLKIESANGHIIKKFVKK
ncbi:MAG: T9SS type A sorting domain-containing protein, partial [Bacteroidia bacterium]